MAIKINKIKGKIVVITGLHIGAGKDVIEIGGTDSPVLKDPITGYPYIPGSSLKGKLRALLEWYEGRVVENQGEVCKCGKCAVCDIFGVSNKEDRKYPTRIVVRDAFIDDETLQKIQQGDFLLFEEKYENSINRITAKPNPRSFERVVPGVKFNFEINYKIFDGEEENKESEVLNKILTAMALLEEDYLGGGGSRGSGKIKFENLTFNNTPIDNKFQKIKNSI